jgi:hypothetical protein
MTISELIKRLEEIKTEYGDLPVCYYDEWAYVTFNEVNWMRNYIGKDNYEVVSDFVGII